MAEMLLINPRKRRGTRKTRKNPVANRVMRRKNPIARVVHRKRRRNPIAALKRRVIRRRNPIAIGGYVAALKEAAIGGAGAVAFDVLWGYVAPNLPASMQKTPGKLGVGEAVKAAATVFIGQALNKATKGMSGKAAKASLTVQFYDIAKSFVPATMTMGGLGYGSPAMIADGTNRVGPIRRGMNGRIGAYTAGSPLLNAYTQPGRTALLSGARQRETQRY